MSDATTIDERNRLPSLGGRVEELCDRFEAAWKSGLRPRIEDHLGEVPEPVRAVLVRALLKLELTYRRRNGERPTPEEYHCRLAEHAGVIDAVFGAAPPLQAARPRAGANHELLFGMLALQNNFIDRETLVAAFAAWVTDKSRDLGRLLLERGAVDTETHALLEALARKHLKLHGGDLEESLAVFSSLDSVRADLDSVADFELRTPLSRVRESHDQTDPDATAPRASTAGNSTAAGVRFRILRLHRSGGLGLVYVARDDELHREVALKEIREQHAHDPDSRSRFVQEAEITGRLEHPGIIPVYGMGTYADGRPFYAMRFIKGDNLKDAIARFHEADVSGREPGERTLVMRELLGRFVAVCNAMAYAHSRGILHRDLKPTNILLGPFGETLVVDWGLAKPVGRPKEASRTDEATLRPDSAGSSKMTLAGDTPGTPAYMSPEQAAGDVDRLGLSSDVYSLGATLYCLLTGKPPFEDPDVVLVLGKVRRGEFPPPSAIKRGIDPALEAICLKAMALVPDGRYASSIALADDIEHWLADEPVSAWREPLSVRARRWRRRNRALVASTAAVLAFGLIGLAAFATVVTGKNRELDVKNVQLMFALASERSAKAEAEANLQAARKAVQDYLTRISENTLLKIQDRADLRALRKELLEVALKYYTGFITSHGDDPKLQAELGDAYTRVGSISDEIGSKNEALRSHERALLIWQELAGGNPSVSEFQNSLAASHNHIGLLQSANSQQAEAMRSYERALAIRQKLADGNPSDSEFQNSLAASHNNIGTLQRATTGQQGEAMRSYERALAIRRKLADDNPSVSEFQNSLAASYNNIGSLQRETGQPSEAMRSHEQALLIRQKLADDNPSVSEFQNNLAKCHNNIGILQGETRRFAEALRSCERALVIWQTLADASPSVTEFHLHVASTHNNIGNLLFETGDTERAREAHGKAQAIRQKLADANPSFTPFQRELAVSHNNVGFLLSATGDTVGSLAAYGKALAIQQKLVDTNPSATQFRRDLATSHKAIGNLLSATGDTVGSLVAYGKALAIQQKLADASPRVSQFQRDLAILHGNIGRLQNATGHMGEALESYQKAVAIGEKLGSVIPVDIYNNARALAQISKLTGPHVEGTAAADRAMRVLRQAVAAGWADAMQTKTDPDLAPLHDRDDFRQLVAELFGRAFPTDAFAR